MEIRARDFLVAIQGRGMMYSEKLSNVVVTSYKKDDMEVTTKVNFFKNVNKVGVTFSIDIPKWIEDEKKSNSEYIIEEVVNKKFIKGNEEKAKIYNLNAEFIDRTNKIMFNFNYTYSKYEDYQISVLSEIISMFLGFIEEISLIEECC